MNRLRMAGGALGLLLLAWTGLAAAAGPVAAELDTAELDTMEQRMLACAACHGEQGRATADGYFPRIAGKPAGYLFEQLLNFRDGRRRYAPMNYLVDRQREAYLLRMAEHFAALDLPYPPPERTAAGAQTLARGEALVHQGDAARELPACTACHGERLTGIEPAVPGLLGLPHDYVVAQIGAWREQIRHARAPDCMAQIAERMTPGDIEAVAAWLAAQPVPTDSHAPRIPLDPPIACGSLEARP